jgi:hypothetical protein
VKHGRASGAKREQRIVSLRHEPEARPALSIRQVVARHRARELLRLGRAGAIVVRRQESQDTDRADHPRTLTGPGSPSA